MASTYGEGPLGSEAGDSCLVSVSLFCLLFSFFSLNLFLRLNLYDNKSVKIITLICS